MKFFTRYIRTVILTTTIVLSIAIYFFDLRTIQSGTTQLTKLEEIYAFLSVIYLYFSLLWGPLYGTFPFIPGKALYYKARRAIGVSSCFFALLHTYITFFLLLGGFGGLGFLSNSYLFAIILGAIGMGILLVLTVTSIDFAVSYLGARWRLLHKAVYVAAFVILIHTVLLGSHFINLSENIPQFFVIGVSFLLLLEAVRFDVYLKRKKIFMSPFGISFVITAVIVAIAIFIVFIGSTSVSQVVNIHAQHQLLAQQALQAANVPQQTGTIYPGLDGDKTKRYTVSFDHPDSIAPNQDTELRFTMFDAANGNPVSFFKTLYTKPVHLIIVDSTLTYFAHIHPTQDGTSFTITTQFPKKGFYHLYVDFQPFGGIEQQIGFSVPVGMNDTDTIAFSQQKPDTILQKTVDGYTVSLNTHGTLDATALSLGNQKISFTVKDAKTNQPITTLKPYLASFGHLVMIDEETFDYMHVHPTNLTPPAPDANGGPTVDFLPIGIYGPFKPGVYRAFVQLNPNGTLITADFTIALK